MAISASGCVLGEGRSCRIRYLVGISILCTWSPPVFLCHCSKATLVRFGGWDAVTLPWPAKSFEDMLDSWDRCEKWRLIDVNDHRELVNIVKYDKRKKGWHGLSLQQDFPRLNLRRGDRVEPCMELPDVDEFLHLAAFPRRILFWRVPEESFCKHRNPIWNSETGIRVDKCGALDWLHGLSLGVFQSFVSFTIHSMLGVDLWATTETTQEAKSAVSMQKLTAEVEEWQKTMARRGRVVTPLGLIPSDCFGTYSFPKCSLKGTQTNWMLEFLVAKKLPIFCSP